MFLGTGRSSTGTNGGSSRLTFLNNCTQISRDSPGIPSGGILTKSGCPLLIRSPVFDAFCTSPNCSLCPSLHTDCETVINPSRVSAGECDSMLRTSGSVEPLMISRAFARRPDVQLSSGFQVRTQRVSIARSGQHARAWTPGCLALEQGLPLNLHALQELTFLCK